MIDWNCQVIQSVHASTSVPKEAIDILHTLINCGFQSFYLSPTFDCTRESVELYLLRRAKSIELLKDATDNPSVKFLPSASVLLQKGLSETESIDKLQIKIGSNRYLPISIPLIHSADEIEAEINRLLYKKHFRLCFQGFELYKTLLEDAAIHRLIRIPNSAFEFGISSFSTPAILPLLFRIRKNQGHILLGTHSISLQKAQNIDFSTIFTTLRQGLTDYEITRLFDNGFL